jgi:hypothetical protein
MNDGQSGFARQSFGFCPRSRIDGDHATHALQSLDRPHEQWLTGQNGCGFLTAKASGPASGDYDADDVLERLG